MSQEKRQKTSKGKEKASYIKQTRASLTGAQKQEVCLKKLQKPTPKNKELAKEYDVSQEMISDILKESEKWLALKLDSYEASLKKQVKPNFPQVDEALGFWVEKAIDNNITISGELLAQKACDFATLLDVQDFKGSDGWVAGFKKRHNLESYVKHGEAASAPSEEDLNEMRKDLQNILKEYSPDDIFNIDKTGLYWKMEPNRTLSTGPVVGKKLSKERVTIALCCNASGTEKVKPVFIGKSQNPRALKNVPKSSLPVQYYWNKTAYMQVSIWNDWLKLFDSRLRLQNRHIILLYDGASTHKLIDDVEFSNICLHKLPPNTTSRFQPCDAGIIYSFKAQYRKLFLQNRIKAFDNSQENGQPIPEITIKKAIKYAAKAWELVQPVTITNGWRKTGILPPSTDDDIDFDFDEFEEVDQLQDLIGQLASKIYRSPISAEEYLEYEKDETNHQMMTDKEIIEMITEPEEPNVEGPEIPIISNYEALAALNQIITYMEQKSDKMEFSNDHIRTIKKLRKVIKWEEFHSKQQVTLDSCFRINKE
ncbi:tigger transposable element-derived protein 6-like [Rhizophagus irregularis DAOM 181602=DAOM 197198]|nr:tigger transposable element-derived protein 6-like [Rhizophagus irregularis DAOM 181602=DAOM 197198]